MNPKKESRRAGSPSPPIADDVSHDDNLYQVLFEESRELISVYDRDGVCLLMNKVVASLHGGQPTDFIGSNFHDLHEAEIAEEYTRRVREVCDDGIERVYDDLVVFLEAKRWLTSTVRPVRNAEGVIIAAQVVSTDVTEQKLTEQSLLESEERFRKVFKAIPDPMSLVRAKDDVCVDFNDRFVETTGWSREEIIGLRSRDLGIWRSKEDWKRLIGSLEGGPVRNFEAEFLCKDGSLITGLLSTISLTIGGEPYMLSIARDITERKRAEDELERARALLQEALERTPAGILIVDGPIDREAEFSPESVRLRLANSVACRLLALPPDSLGNTLANWNEGTEVLRPDGSPYPDDALPIPRAIFMGKATEGLEAVLRNGDGEEHTVVAGGAPIRDVQGQVTAAVAVFVDITEQRREAQRRAELERRLQQSQKMEALGTLAGGISHEFNNLLGGIMGFTELALMGTEEGRGVREELEQVLLASERARDLVRQILAFSRQAISQMTTVDLCAEVQRIANLLQTIVPRMIDIRLDVSDVPIWISANEAQLEQLLLNLGSNAADAMPEGGQLSISVTEQLLDESFCDEHPELEPGAYGVLRVRDTGCGIATEVKSKIFDPFFTTKGLGKGTGLGLSTVFGYVNGHGGLCLCESEVGEGAEFTIYLPLLDERRSIAVSTPPPGTTPVGGDEGILLVDDEAALRDVGARVLGAAGYSVTTVNNAEEALETWEERGDSFSLVLLDLSMPGRGGRWCLEQLLQRDSTIKVVVSSGYSAESSVRELLELGARGFIAKPFRKDELLGTVRGVLDEAERVDKTDNQS